MNRVNALLSRSLSDVEEGEAIAICQQLLTSTVDTVEIDWMMVGAVSTGAGNEVTDHFQGQIRHFLIVPGEATDLHDVPSGRPGWRITDSGVRSCIPTKAERAYRQLIPMHK